MDDLIIKNDVYYTYYFGFLFIRKTIYKKYFFNQNGRCERDSYVIKWFLFGKFLIKKEATN